MSELTLRVRGLETAFVMPEGEVPVIREINLEVRRGEVFGLIGESGSGKTVTGMSILRLLPDNAVTRAQALEFHGADILALSSPAFRKLRGTRMAMVFQDPVGAFNPAKRIGWHLREVFGSAAAKSPILGFLNAGLPPLGLQSPAEDATS